MTSRIRLRGGWSWGWGRVRQSARGRARVVSLGRAKQKAHLLEAVVMRMSPKNRGSSVFSERIT